MNGAPRRATTASSGTPGTAATIWSGITRFSGLKTTLAGDKILVSHLEDIMESAGVVLAGDGGGAPILKGRRDLRRAGVTVLLAVQAVQTDSADPRASLRVLGALGRLAADAKDSVDSARACVALPLLVVLTERALLCGSMRGVNEDQATSSCPISLFCGRGLGTRLRQGEAGARTCSSSSELGDGRSTSASTRSCSSSSTCSGLLTGFALAGPKADAS